MSGRANHFFRYRFPAIFWALVIYAASSIPANDLPNIFLLKFDKLIHIGIFFVLGVLVYRALEPYIRAERFDWKRAILVVVIVIAYAFSDEFHQSSVPGRSVDGNDILADTVGGMLSGLFVYVLFLLKRRAARTAL